MCENCTKSIAKFFLIFINLIFMLAGILMLGFSIAAVVAPFKFMNFFLGVAVDDAGLNSLLMSIGVFGIVLGAIVVIVAFFGFAGATCNSLCLLVMYLILIILILLAEIALIITAAVLPLSSITINTKPANEVKSLIDNFRTSDISTDNNDQIISSQNPWSLFQLKFKCCGIRDIKDYSKANNTLILYKGNEANSLVPLSCCTASNPTPTTFIADDINGCRTGNKTNPPCLSVLEDKVKSSNKIILGVAAGILGLEVLMIIFTGILIHHLRKEKNNIV